MKYYSNDSDDCKSIIIMIFVIIVLCVVIGVSINGKRENSREERNMIYIEEGYCYDKNTKIIYIENLSGQYGQYTSYTPYYGADGQLYKYDAATTDWVAMEEK